MVPVITLGTKKWPFGPRVMPDGETSPWSPDDSTRVFVILSASGEPRLSIFPQPCAASAPVGYGPVYLKTPPDVASRIGRRSRRVEIQVVVVVDVDALTGREVEVELAVRDLRRVVRREPHRELTVRGAAGFVADVGRDDAAVGQHAASVVVGIVGRRLIGGHQPRDALDPEVADRVPATSKMPQPAGGFGWCVSSPVIR